MDQWVSDIANRCIYLIAWCAPVYRAGYTSFDDAEFPKCAGAYVAISDDKILYVGSAVSLYRRWQSGRHHRVRDLSELNCRGVVWLEINEESIAIAESTLIKSLNPVLNGTLTADMKEYHARLNEKRGEIARRIGGMLESALDSVSDYAAADAVVTDILSKNRREWLKLTAAQRAAVMVCHCDKLIDFCEANAKERQCNAGGDHRSRPAAKAR